MCVFEPGCWCRCRVPLRAWRHCRVPLLCGLLLPRQGALGAWVLVPLQVPLLCALELGWWCRAAAVPLGAWALVPLQGAAMCRCCVRLGAGAAGVPLQCAALQCAAGAGVYAGVIFGTAGNYFNLGLSELAKHWNLLMPTTSIGN